MYLILGGGDFVSRFLWRARGGRVSCFCFPPPLAKKKRKKKLLLSGTRYRTLNCGSESYSQKMRPKPASTLVLSFFFCSGRQKFLRAGGRGPSPPSPFCTGQKRALGCNTHKTDGWLVVRPRKRVVDREEEKSSDPLMCVRRTSDRMNGRKTTAEACQSN